MNISALKKSSILMEMIIFRTERVLFEWYEPCGGRLGKGIPA